MADQDQAKPAPASGPEGKSPDEIALELMKFIAVQTGYGKGGATAGFAGKTAKTAEEYADALLDLYQRCRKVLEE